MVVFFLIIMLLCDHSETLLHFYSKRKLSLKTSYFLFLPNVASINTAILPAKIVEIVHDLRLIRDN